MSKPSERPLIKMARRGSFLAPCSPFDAGLIEALPDKPVFVRVAQSRNGDRLRYYWAMLKIVRDNLDQDISSEALHAFTKIKCGLVEPMKLKSGDVIQLPASIAFDKLSEADFSDFLTKAMNLFGKLIDPKMLEKEAKAEIGSTDVRPDHKPEARKAVGGKAY